MSKFVTYDILLKYNKSNNGPKLGPCETPLVILCEFEFLLHILYIADACLSSLRFNALPLIPKLLFALFDKILCLAVSKALNKSRKKRDTNFA